MRPFIALLAVTVLGGCAGLKSGEPPLRQQVQLSDFFINDGEKVRRYVDVIGPLPPVKWYDAALPEGWLAVSDLPLGSEWMGQFDLNKDSGLDEDEMLQAWMVAYASWKTGYSFAPNSLEVSPKAIKALPTAESKALRKAISNL